MSEQKNEVRGIRKLGTFITADALLVVVLLVWAQLWVLPSLQLWGNWYPELAKMPNGFEPFNLSGGLGLFWSYLAVFLALVALGWAGWCSLEKPSDKAPDFAIGLFAASIGMAVINVLQSCFTVSVKVLKAEPIWGTLVPTEASPKLWYGLFIGLAFLIVALSIWGVRAFKKNKCRYLPWKIEVIVVLIFGGIGVFLMREALGNPLFWILVVVIGLTLVVIIWFFGIKRKWSE